jgi:hypothetical protein
VAADDWVSRLVSDFDLLVVASFALDLSCGFVVDFRFEPRSGSDAVSELDSDSELNPLLEEDSDSDGAAAAAAAVGDAVAANVAAAAAIVAAAAVVVVAVGTAAAAIAAAAAGRGRGGGGMGRGMTFEG